MSIHPSLKVDSATSQQKTVLSRIQRIKDLMKKGEWTEGRSVISLPKTKILKVKTRKTPKGKPEEATAAAGAEATIAQKTKAKA